MKHLIVYFSRKGENYCAGSIKTLTKGNTQIAAELIQSAIGGELFELVPVTAYSEGYRACVEEAKKEFHESARPALKAVPESLDGYDVVFVGYPNWCGTMPMPVFSFLEKFDWTGRKIAPFCTNEGSGMGVSERDLKKVCAGAIFKDGLSVRGSSVAQSADMIARWAKECLH